MIEAISQVEALVHEELGLLRLSRDGEHMLADILQPRRAGAGFGRRIELLIGGLIVFVDGDLGVQRGRCQTQHECSEAQRAVAHSRSPWGFEN
jgi:hypothetical protein